MLALLQLESRLSLGFNSIWLCQHKTDPPNSSHRQLPAQLRCSVSSSHAVLFPLLVYCLLQALAGREGEGSCCTTSAIGMSHPWYSLEEHTASVYALPKGTQGLSHAKSKIKWLKQNAATAAAES